MDSRVVLEIDAGVAELRLNRPDKINSLDVEMFGAIADAIVDISANPAVRCVVLSGEGRGFCAGIDLSALASSPELLDLLPRTHGDANLFQSIAWGWRTCAVPVIAAVHGVAFGAGCQFMLGADLRIAAPDAEIAMMEMRWGLVPDAGGIALLRGLVRDDVARDIVLTGRRMSGVEAAGVGLVTRLSDDPRAEALTLARQIAASSPDAVRAAKRLLNLPSGTSPRDLMLAESAEQQVLLASSNHREALAAGREKRPPQFIFN